MIFFIHNMGEVKLLFAKKLDDLSPSFVHKNKKIVESIEDIGVGIFKIILFKPLFVRRYPKALGISTKEVVDGSNEGGFSAPVIP